MTVNQKFCITFTECLINQMKPARNGIMVSFMCLLRNYFPSASVSFEIFNDHGSNKAKQEKKKKGDLLYLCVHQDLVACETMNICATLPWANLTWSWLYAFA